MSISTSSACLPEMRRRPSMSAAETKPSAAMTPTYSQSRCLSWLTSAWSITFFPVTQMSAICAACEPTASGGGAARVAARDRGAVERRVELLLLELEPAAQRAAGPPPPRQPLLALDHARRLAEEVRALPGTGHPHGQRLERIAGLDAGV